MSPHESKQSRDRDPPDLFESSNPRVSLPPMPYIQGNAFAQMKAKEKERQMQMGESGGLDEKPRPSTGSGRRSNGLDYDQELALPMPKPRHLPPTEAELAEVTSRQRRSSSAHRSRLTKKRSGDLAAAGSPTDTDKKKSKVASLRSKFSLKDLAREFRRDTSSPPPAVPALRKSSSSGITVDGGPRTPQLAQTPPSFSQERLYVPKARKADMDQPSSAPARTSSFQESLTGDRASQSSMYSSPPGVTAATAKGDKKTERFRHALVHDDSNAESLTMGQTQTDKRLKTLLLDGSSPPAHTGELRNAGHPEVVASGQRICSMKAEQGPVTPIKTSGPIVPAAQTPDEYSPSIYNDESSVATIVPNTGPAEQKKSAADERQQRPLIVSSDNKEKKKLPRAGPNRPTFVPGPAHAQYASGQQQQNQPFAHQLDVQIPLDEARFFTGMTSHGGFAPPPPHPGYQNTTTLEQHMTSHANSIHHHIDTALGKLGRNTENNINWSTDQVIRQVESVTDMARMLNTRTVNQAELIREVQQAVEYLRIQVSEMQHQAFRMENKLAECIHGEMAQVRAEIRSLAASSSRAPYNIAGGWSSSHGELQGASQHLAKGTKDFYEKRVHSKKKSRAVTVPKSEGTVKRPDESQGGPAEHSTQGECVVAASAGILADPSKRAENQEQTSAAGDRSNLSERGERGGDDIHNLHSHPSVPTPTDTFDPPSLHTNKESGALVDREGRRAPKDPRQESSGSPQPKGSKPAGSTHLPFLSPDGGSDAHNMVFGFGRSDKDKKAKEAEKKSDKDTQSPQKEDKLDAKEMETEPKEAVSNPKDNIPVTEDEPKTEGEPSTEKAVTDEKPDNEAKSETKSVKADTKDVKSTPKDKKHKKGMFNFKRHRDGSNQSSGGFLRTPQRHKESKTAIAAPKELTAQPVPVPNPTIPNYDLYCPLPGSPEAIANYNSTEGDPAFVHPALRTPQQKAILAERERLRLEGSARQQSAEQSQQSQQTSAQDQHMSPQQSVPYNSNPALPHHIPGTPYRGPPSGAPPVAFRPTLPGRQQQPAPFTHPQPPAFGQAPSAIVSHYYGPHGSNNNLATSGLTGAPNVLMPPRYQPSMPFNGEGIDMRRWYQEARGHTSLETDRPLQASQSSQGNQPNSSNSPN